jgi:uncharacterized protein (DUF1015 family)
MADVRPLRGVRYDPRRLTNVGRLIAPPYDTTDLARSDDSTLRSTFNIAEVENVDLANGSDSHLVAASRYQDWRQRGLLIRDDKPALYVHDHRYRAGDEVRDRRGLLARVRLADWDERVILPHERTIPGPRNERLARLRAVRANLSPLYLLYQDESGEVRRTLAAATASTEPIATGEDINGAQHRLSRLDDERVLETVPTLFAGKPLFVADGHHRYEAALAYRGEQRCAGAGNEASSEFVLAMLADINDPGVSVRPTHRLIHDLPDFDPTRFRRQVEEVFVVATDSGGGAGLDHAVCVVLIAGEPQPWRVSLRPDRAHVTLLPGERSRAWRAFDVAIADSVILESILGLGTSRLADHVAYTQDPNVARHLVEAGDAQLALVFAPPSLAALTRVAEAGDLLPPKSTFFDPKPPAGLVIHDLSDS